MDINLIRKSQIDNYKIARLVNWFRAYRDKPIQNVSITFIFCRYCLETMKRAKETDGERRKREEREIEEKRLRSQFPPPDYKDARILQQAWEQLPLRHGAIPLKSLVKTMVFGNADEGKKLRNHYRINKEMSYQMTRTVFKLFFEKVDSVERKQKSL